MLNGYASTRASALSEGCGQSGPLSQLCTSKENIPQGRFPLNGYTTSEASKPDYLGALGKYESQMPDQQHNMSNERGG